MQKQGQKTEYLERINEMLNFALDNEFSDFYRNKYRGLKVKGIRSLEDFQNVPYLSKEEIINVPLGKRIFVPEEEILSFSTSNGTTGTNLTVPNSIEPNSYDEERLINLGIKNLLILSAPIAPSFFTNIRTRRNEIVIIPGNIYKLRQTALLIKEVGIQGLRTTSTVLYKFNKVLDEVGFDKGQIKLIILGGESCTKLRLEYFKENFKNALFEFRYGASETGTIRGKQCPTLAGKGPNLFHPNPNIYFEIEDKECFGNGEIIQTDLSPKAFPLLRYKTGDFGQILKEKCECGKPILQVEGKNNHDIYRQDEFTIAKSKVDEALLEFSSLIEPNFQLEITGSSSPELTLKIATKAEAQRISKLEDNIEDTITEKLFLNPEHNLKYFLKEKLITSFKVIATKDWENSGTKTKNIIVAGKK